MKRTYLQKIYQGSQVAYIGSADPRILNAMIIHAEADDEKYQRAISETRVKEISDYVAGGENAPTGILPGALILGTRNQDKPKIHTTYAQLQDRNGQFQQLELYYIDLPETEEELKECRNTLTLWTVSTD